MPVHTVFRPDFTGHYSTVGSTRHSDRILYTSKHTTYNVKFDAIFMLYIAHIITTPYIVTVPPLSVNEKHECMSPGQWERASYCLSSGQQPSKQLLVCLCKLLCVVCIFLRFSCWDCQVLCSQSCIPCIRKLHGLQNCRASRLIVQIKIALNGIAPSNKPTKLMLYTTDISAQVCRFTVNTPVLSDCLSSC